MSVRSRSTLVLSFIVTASLGLATLAPGGDPASARATSANSRLTLATPAGRSSPLAASRGAPICSVWYGLCSRARRQTRTGTPGAVSATSKAPTETKGPVSASLLLAEWTRVADCEEGGWVGWSGPAYPDSVGIDAANWVAYGGGTDESPMAQIAVARRITAAIGEPNWVPDQDGCAPW